MMRAMKDARQPARSAAMRRRAQACECADALMPLIAADAIFHIDAADTIYVYAVVTSCRDVYAATRCLLLLISLCRC